MKTSLNAGVHAPRQVAGIRQRVAARPLPALSPVLLRPAACIAAAAMLAALLGSQLLAHQVKDADGRIALLEQQHAALIVEHKGLKSGQDQLTSEAYVLAVAGAKFDLHRPGQGQVHRWR